MGTFYHEATRFGEMIGGETPPTVMVSAFASTHATVAWIRLRQLPKTEASNRRRLLKETRGEIAVALAPEPQPSLIPTRRFSKNLAWEGFLPLGSLMNGAGTQARTAKGLETNNSRIEQRRKIASWVAREVIGHEKAVRAWLSRNRVADDDAEELVQEAYCRLSMLESVDHIDRADAYFFSIVRNLLVRRVKRARVVAIEAIAEIEAYGDASQPSPEQQVAARLDLNRVLAFIETLPERCGTVVRLRKIEGWSQKEIATHLGMTEKAVEKQVWLGVKAIQRAWSERDRASAAQLKVVATRRPRA